VRGTERFEAALGVSLLLAAAVCPEPAIEPGEIVLLSGGVLPRYRDRRLKMRDERAHVSVSQLAVRAPPLLLDPSRWYELRDGFLDSL
jgi:hypothetical protein